MSNGDMHGEGGMHGWWGGERACVAGETATAAGSTHHTGMHSCLTIVLQKSMKMCFGTDNCKLYGECKYAKVSEMCIV